MSNRRRTKRFALDAMVLNCRLCDKLVFQRNPVMMNSWKVDEMGGLRSCSPWLDVPEFAV